MRPFSGSETLRHILACNRPIRDRALAPLVLGEGCVSLILNSRMPAFRVVVALNMVRVQPCLLITNQYMVRTLGHFLQLQRHGVFSWGEVVDLLLSLLLVERLIVLVELIRIVRVVAWLHQPL